jgi:hypothetical protein
MDHNSGIVGTHRLVVRKLAAHEDAGVDALEQYRAVVGEIGAVLSTTWTRPRS